MNSLLSMDGTQNTGTYCLSEKEVYYASKPNKRKNLKNLKNLNPNAGDNMGTMIVNQLSVRPIQRSVPSVALLTPYVDPTGAGTYAWPAQQPLILTPSRNYTVRDYRAFFEDMGFADGYNMYTDSAGLLPSLSAPDVEMFCMYGTGTATPAAFQYTSYYKFPDSQPYVLSEPIGVGMSGDGTVNIRSLRACQLFADADAQTEPVWLKPLAGEDHLQMLHSKQVLAAVRDVLVQINNGSDASDRMSRTPAPKPPRPATNLRASNPSPSPSPSPTPAPSKSAATNFLAFSPNQDHPPRRRSGPRPRPPQFPL